MASTNHFFSPSLTYNPHPVTKSALTFFVWLILLISFCGSAQNQISDYRLIAARAAGFSVGNGSIFSVNTDGTDYRTIKKFQTNVDGAVPSSELIKLSTGELVGTTWGGGEGDFGVIYKLNPDGSGYTKIFDFKGSGASRPGKLMEASNGYLYGLASTKTVDQSLELIVFRILRDGTKYEQLEKIADGIGPQPLDFGWTSPVALTQGSDGKLYGSTGYAVFKINLDGSGYTKLYDAWVKGEVIEGADGELYFLTGDQFDSPNRALILRMDKSGSSVETVSEYLSGNYFVSSLLKLPNGTMVGTMAFQNILYSIQPGQTGYKVLYTFSEFPSGNLILGSDGRLYGGDRLSESIFSINTDGTDFKYIKSASKRAFRSEIIPLLRGVRVNGLLETSPGTFIGTVRHGSASWNGSIFKISSSGEYLMLKEFYEEGSDPRQSLVYASDGFLYGSTSKGGQYGFGTLFKMKPNGSDFKTIYHLDANTVGYQIGTDLVELPEGHLIGIIEGFNSDQSKIFKVNTDGSDFRTLETLPNFFVSRGQLMRGSDRNLYGAYFDLALSPKRGIVFKINGDESDYKVLVDFSTEGLTEAVPLGVVEGNDGFLYGIGGKAPSPNNSPIFRIKKDGTNFTENVASIPNYNPQYAAVLPAIFSLANNGKFYFSIEGGIVQFDPITNNAGIVMSNPSAHEGCVVVQNQVITHSRSSLMRFDPMTLKTETKQYDNYVESSPMERDELSSRAIAVPKQTQTISFSLVDKTVVDEPFALITTSSAGLQLTYSSSDNNVANVHDNMVTIVGAGTATITATQAGDNSYQSASLSKKLLVKKLKQTISLGDIPSQTFLDAPFNLQATASSTLAVTFVSSNMSVASVNGNVVTIIGAGTANIRATQLGNNIYDSASSVTRTLVVAKANQTITFDAITPQIVGGPAFALKVSSSSGLPVQLTSLKNKISISGDQASLVSSGKETIIATQAGNSNYQAASSVERTFCINPSKPTISSHETNGNFLLTSSNEVGNQWYRNGVSLDNAADRSLVADVSGKYSVQTAVEGCSSLFSDVVEISITSLETNQDPTLQIAPNPTTGVISIARASGGLSLVDVVNFLGQKQVVNLLANESELKIDLSNVAPGIYFVRFLDFGRATSIKVIRH